MIRNNQDLTPKIGLAAGMIKTLTQMEQSRSLLDLASHITFGSFTLELREGNKEPTYYFDDKTQNSINAVGLTNQGLESFLIYDLPHLIEIFHKKGVSIRISLAPLGPGDLTKMCTMLNQSPLRQYIDEVEVNAACPNHRGSKGLHAVLAHDTKALKELMAETEHLELQRAIKLAPEMKESSLSSVVELCTQFGFSTIVSGNTLLGSSTIDGKQRLSVDKGGQAGAILLDIGVGQINYLAPLCKEGHIKLIACGGVLSTRAFIEYDNVGADEVQIATGFMQYGPKIFQDILTALI